VVRENPSVRKQRNNDIDTVRKLPKAGRTIYYTDEKWPNKSMISYRTWNDDTSNASLKVPSGKGGRIIAAHAGPQKDEPSDKASWVFVGKKNSGDYHAEMDSSSWLNWLEESVLPKILGGFLEIELAPYILVRNEAARPAASRFRKNQYADFLQAHALVRPSRGHIGVLRVHGRH